MYILYLYIYIYLSLKTKLYQMYIFFSEEAPKSLQKGTTNKRLQLAVQVVNPTPAKEVNTWISLLILIVFAVVTLLMLNSGPASVSKPALPPLEASRARYPIPDAGGRTSLIVIFCKNFKMSKVDMQNELQVKAILTAPPNFFEVRTHDLADFTAHVLSWTWRHILPSKVTSRLHSEQRHIADMFT